MPGCSKGGCFCTWDVFIVIIGPAALALAVTAYVLHYALTYGSKSKQHHAKQLQQQWQHRQRVLLQQHQQTLGYSKPTLSRVLQLLCAAVGGVVMASIGFAALYYAENNHMPGGRMLPPLSAASTANALADVKLRFMIHPSFVPGTLAIITALGVGAYALLYGTSISVLNNGTVTPPGEVGTQTHTCLTQDIPLCTLSEQVTPAFIASKVAQGERHCIVMLRPGAHHSADGNVCAQLLTKEATALKLASSKSHNAHLAYMFSLMAKGELVLSGCVLEHKDMCTLSIFRGHNRTAVEALVKADPLVGLGIYDYEIFEFFSISGLGIPPAPMTQ